MADAVRLFLVAGEPSGDRIGADLIKRLRVQQRVTLTGVGGAELEGEGLRSIFPMADLSVMGVADVLKRLPLLLWRIRQTAQAILAQKPDLVVLIDSQVFSEKVATQLRAANYEGDILLYVAPSVWAWKPERAPELRPLYNEVLAVLPFEPAVMKRLNGPLTSYVGHPALHQTVFRDRQPQRGPILLLPGSRVGELRRHLPLMATVAHALRNHPRVTGFVLPTPRHLEQRVVDEITAWKSNIFVTTTTEAKRAAFADSIVAAAVSGTVTLELALSGVPMVITYVGDRGQIGRWRKHKPRFIGLPNILAGSDIAPEHVGPEPQPGPFIADIERLLDEPDEAERQRVAYARIRAGMEKGAPEAPLVDAVERVLAHLPQRLPTST
ncbi:MAG: lipid-A-disaccharide synthase [Devosia sp.]